MSEWIGVDLDGTLAHYTEWQGPTVIGAPIVPMVERVKRWLAEDRQVRIFTARIGDPDLDADDRWEIKAAIGQWCEEHIGQYLETTNVKDMHMIELWDDRAVQVIPNTGQPVGKSTRGLD